MLEQLLDVARAYLPVPAAGGGIWFASDLTGISQVFRMDGPDRFPIRVLPSQERTYPIAETPFGLLVRHDVNGDERWRIGVLEPDGNLRPVTHDPKSFFRDRALSPDGRKLGVSYNPGGQRDWVLGAIDLATGEMEEWHDGGGVWSWAGWSPDGKTAAVIRSVRGNGRRTQAYLLEQGGEPRPVLPDTALTVPFWAGTRLLAMSSVERDFDGLVEIDPTTGEVLRRIIDEDHDVIAVEPAPDGRRIAVVVNVGANDAIRIIDLATGTTEPVAMPRGVVFRDGPTGAGDHISWAVDGSGLFVAWESPTSPAEIYAVPGTRWTRATGDPMPALVDAEDVVIPSFDGLPVPALLYRVDDTPRPTVVLFHGGPTRQSRANFNVVTAMWGAVGYNVLALNFRGSTGYGRRFTELDDRELRWDAVRDGCAAGHWLREQGHATHLIAMGGSYGGFMTLAVMVEEPELWSAGIDLVGIANWISFFTDSPPALTAMRGFEYGDPNGPDAEFLVAFSPLHRADEIKAPLMIIHGRNDPRVPVTEAIQIHEAVAGSELLIFEDEGHGLVHHRNRITAYTRAIAFVREAIG